MDSPNKLHFAAQSDVRPSWGSFMVASPYNHFHPEAQGELDDGGRQSGEKTGQAAHGRSKIGFCALEGPAMRCLPRLLPFRRKIARRFGHTSA